MSVTYPMRRFSVALALALCLLTPLRADGMDPAPMPSASQAVPTKPPPPDPKTVGAGSGATNPPEEPSQRPPKMKDATLIQPDWVNVSLFDLVKYFSELTGKQFIIGDPGKLNAKVTIISHKKVPVWQAYEAFLSALEVAGFTTTRAGNAVKVVPSNKAVQTPIPVGVGDAIPYSDQVVTQLITPENVSVSEVNAVVSSLMSPDGKVIAYQNSNTLILTDHAYSIRKVYKVISELDVGAPKSRMVFYRLRYAPVAEVQQLIESLYGTEDPAAEAAANARSSRSRRSRRSRDRSPEPEVSNASTTGKAAKYIDKVLSDERTNSIIVLANDEGHVAVEQLLQEIDVDVDLSHRSQIHTVRLEHAKAQEVMDVLNRLSGSNTGGSSTNRRTPPTRPVPGARTKASDAKSPEQNVGAAAAFDSGMRIAHDESTNSLVIIAPPEDFRVIKGVIAQLDQKRKQVFIDAVILELTSEDSNEFNLAVHGPFTPGNDTTGLVSSQLGTQSLGLSQDLLSGLALGVFGPSVSVPMADGTTLDVPSFGIVLHAIETFSGVDIVSNPHMLALDNTEAKISVGRKIPFPTNTSFNSLSQPVISFTREDVATTMEITPRINSSNHVTMEIRVEVAEVENSAQNTNLLQTGGPTTSNREVETTALVGDNQTVVLGGLMAVTETKTETKVPILGDLPLIGALFRGTSNVSRKGNLLIFLTPHIIENEADMAEIMRVKEAQYTEFRKRFFGRSKERQVEQIRQLLQGSMNRVDKPSMYRTEVDPTEVKVDGEPVTPATQDVYSEVRKVLGTVENPGAGAGDLPLNELSTVQPEAP